MKIVAGFITYEKETYKYLNIFIPSLIKALRYVDDFKIIAVDNSEDSKENYNYIKGNYPEIEIIAAGKNIGFSRAYNKMIEKSKKWSADYFFIINPDTYITENSVYKLLQTIENDGNLGSVSPLLVKWDFINNKSDNCIDSLGIQLKPGLHFKDLGQAQELSELNKFKNYSIMGISGAAGLYRMKALESVEEESGYFDENMFMYKEDADLAYRLFLQGYSAKTNTLAVIYHDRSAGLKIKSSFLPLISRGHKSKFARKCSFLNQHIIYYKYFNLQNLKTKIIIIKRILLMFAYVVIKERFQLSNYIKFFRKRKKIKKYRSEYL